MATILSPKDPSETILLSFDFYNLMTDTSEILISAIWDITVVSGIDPNAATCNTDMLIPSITFTNAICSQLFTGGVNGVLYKIDVLVTTNKNQVFKSVAQISVKIL